MIQSFKLYTAPASINVKLNEGTASEYMREFDLFLAESYAIQSATDRYINEIRVRAMMTLDENANRIINEAIIGPAIKAVVNLVKSIRDYIKGIIDKMAAYKDAITKNIEGWNKTVAPRALANAGNMENLTKLDEAKLEGFKWDTGYITTGILASLDKLFATTASVDFGGSKLSIKGNPNDTSTAIKTVTDTAVKDAREAKTQQQSTTTSTTDDKKDEGSNPLGGVTNTSKQETSSGGTSTDASGMKDTLSEALANFLKSEFNATKEDYINQVTLKAKGSEQASPKGNFSKSIIEGYVKFVSEAPGIITKINERYSTNLDGYNKLVDILESAERSLSNVDNQGGLEAIRAITNYFRECTAINNKLIRFNVTLVEQCAKEYITICNKIAFMKEPPKKKDENAPEDAKKK